MHFTKRFIRSILFTPLLALAGLFLAHCGQSVPPPEDVNLKLGFISLVDCAPLVVALEKGFFAKEGLTKVEVTKQASWGATRDNLELGSDKGGIDGAHILTPMPYGLHLGLNTKENRKVPMAILCRLDYNNQAISVAAKHKGLHLGIDASPLKAPAAAAKAAGKPLTVAVTFPIGTHNYWMRYWLAAAGIDPDNDVKTIVIPPPQMVANVKTGNMDAFCVGEPWGQQGINQGVTYTALMTQELWNNHPEKSLAVRKDWIAKYPRASLALMRAVITAQRWCDDPANATELATILAKKNWVNCQVEDILPRIKGEIDYGDGRPKTSGQFMKFFKDNASFPYKSHEMWFLTETKRWGLTKISTAEMKQAVDEVNQSALWREAAKSLGLDSETPKTDSRGIETFFDGKKFDPENPDAYLASLTIKR